MDGVELRGTRVDGHDAVLTPGALSFLADLEREFRGRRRDLLERRSERRAALGEGEMPRFLESTRWIRQDASWRVAAAPADLRDRRVEITGPVDRKMMINALNSGARCFMADFEDANAPTWPNCIGGQANLREAVARTLSLETSDRSYRLTDEPATLLVRPRGWHLVEKHVLVDGEPVSASLFDFGMAFSHCARPLLEAGSGPYFYLPKLESQAEARLWNDVFGWAQDRLGIPRGTIRATVLIETILAAFEMEEILWELRDHGCALNAGRWDYIFSVVKNFGRRPDAVLPDRAEVTMMVPFMRAYTELLVATCHKRGAHAIGGMSAFIPSRRDPEANERALARVREDKERESGDGFDGTWVAHPDLVPVVAEVFEKRLGSRPNQLARTRDVHVTPSDLLDFRVSGGAVTADGVRANVDVGMRYLESWFAGNGAAAIHDLMEDTATAEISRSQLWQWLHHRTEVQGIGPLTPAHVRDLVDATGVDGDPREVFEEVVLSDDFVEFLTIPAYQRVA